MRFTEAPKIRREIVVHLVISPFQKISVMNAEIILVQVFLRRKEHIDEKRGGDLSVLCCRNW